MENKEYIALLGYTPNSPKAKMAIAYRNSLAEYGKLEACVIDPSKLIEELGIILPQDSIDFINFTIIFAEAGEFEIDEEFIAQSIGALNRLEVKLIDVIKETVSILSNDN